MRRESGRTVAAQAGDLEITRALIDAGADLNDGSPVLWPAVLSGNAEVVDVLLARGLDPSNSRHRLIDRALEQDSPAMVSVLNRHGAGLDWGGPGDPVIFDALRRCDVERLTWPLDNWAWGSMKDATGAASIITPPSALQPMDFYCWDACPAVRKTPLDSKRLPYPSAIGPEALDPLPRRAIAERPDASDSSLGQIDPINLFYTVAAVGREKPERDVDPLVLSQRLPSRTLERARGLTIRSGPWFTRLVARPVCASSSSSPVQP